MLVKTFQIVLINSSIIPNLVSSLKSILQLTILTPKPLHYHKSSVLERATWWSQDLTPIE